MGAVSTLNGLYLVNDILHAGSGPSFQAVTSTPGASPPQPYHNLEWDAGSVLYAISGTTPEIHAYHVA